MLARLWVVVIVTGCIDSGQVICSDGVVCPADNTCRELTNPAQEVCATPNQIAACAGLTELAPCMLAGTADARCYDGVCEPAGCGNGRVDPGEACDDGNAIVGDGCSDACLSNETCGNGIVDPLHIDTSGIAQPDEQCDDSNLVSHDGCASDCQNEAPTWSPITIGPPPVRDDAHAVFDSARRRIVMFGGGVLAGAVGNGGTLSDTWEWDGLGWRLVATAVQPPARVGAALAYDSVRHRVVLFGGASTQSQVIVGSGFSDTWEYDGTNWIERTTATVPPPRFDMGVAYDGKRHVVVMFGGTGDDAAPLGDTWEYDGKDWTERTDLTTTPPARASAAMAFDPKRSVIVMAGGALTDTWEYDGAWHDVTPASVASRSDLYTKFQLTFDPATHAVLGFGGLTASNAFNGNTWSWNGVAWQKVATTGITARASTTLIGDPLHGNTLAFGGYNIYTCGIFGCYQSFNDTYKWNGVSWSAVTIAAPAPREDVMAALDSARGVMVMFGGQIFNNGLMTVNDTWELGAGHWTQMNPTTPPSLRGNGAIAYDAARAKTVLFGGLDANTNAPLADTWLWNGAQWSLVTPAMSPPARGNVSAAYDPVRQRVVMFGGDGVMGSNSPLGDTWEWDGTTWSQVATTGPNPRMLALMTWDPKRRRVVMTGGRKLNGEFRDTWEWDGATWTPMDTSATVQPGGRSLPGVAWDGPRQQLELFGGNQGVPSNDTWEWNGQTWAIRFPAQVPPPRDAATIVPSLDGGGVMMFGGEDSATVPYTVYNDLWQLTWSSPDPFEVCSLADLDSDGDGLAGCADPDCWARCTPLCPPGAQCDPSWPHCGDGTCSGVEDCRLCPQDCGACPSVCGDGFCDAPETTATCPGDC